MIENQPATIKAPRVLIGTPSLDGNLCIEYVSSLMHTQQLCQSFGIMCDLSVLRGDAFIAKARNNIVKQFMESTCDVLFFIDSDQGWDAQAFLRMVLDPHEIVAGAVPKKTDLIEFNGLNLDAAENGDCTIENGMLRAKHVGTGFMKITRSVIEKMVATGAREVIPGDGSPHAFIWEIFETPIIKAPGAERGQFWGEDLAFCDKWLKMGGYVWIDPNIDFIHVGRKAYTGNLFKYLEEKGAIKVAKVPVDIVATPKLSIVDDFASTVDGVPAEKVA